MEVFGKLTLKTAPQEPEDAARLEEIQQAEADMSASLAQYLPRESFRQIQTNTGDIESLRGIGRVSAHLGSAPSQEALTGAWEAAKNVAPADGATVVNLDQDAPSGHAWSYLDSATGYAWADRGTDTVNLATNDSPGIVKGSTDNGKGFVENDGTITMVGYDVLVAADVALDERLSAVSGAKIVRAGTCSTAAGTTAKVITLYAPWNTYTPQDRDEFEILFTTTQTATSQTWDINGSGAKTVVLGAGNVDAYSGRVSAANTWVKAMYNATRNVYQLLGSQDNVDDNTTYGAATTSAAGLMSAADKTKLNGIAEGATKVTVVDSVTSTSATDAASAAAVKTAYDLANGKAPTSHASTATTYGAATTTNYGHVSLADPSALKAPAAMPYLAKQTNTDLNALRAVGFYFGTFTNYPSDAGTAYGSCLVQATDTSTGYRNQIYIPDGTDKAMYYRTTGSTSSWGSWTKIGGGGGSGSGLAVFTDNGSWTCPAGVTWVCITAIAAGGNGGAAYSESTAANGAGGGGGGCGQWVRDMLAPVTPGNSYAVTVGTGNTSFGSLLYLAKGANGGNGASGRGGDGGAGGAYLPWQRGAGGTGAAASGASGGAGGAGAGGGGSRQAQTSASRQAGVGGQGYDGGSSGGSVNVYTGTISAANGGGGGGVPACFVTSQSGTTYALGGNGGYYQSSSNIGNGGSGGLYGAGGGGAGAYSISAGSAGAGGNGILMIGW